MTLAGLSWDLFASHVRCTYINRACSSFRVLYLFVLALNTPPVSRAESTLIQRRRERTLISDSTLANVPLIKVYLKWILQFDRAYAMLHQVQSQHSHALLYLCSSAFTHQRKHLGNCSLPSGPEEKRPGEPKASGGVEVTTRDSDHSSKTMSLFHPDWNPCVFWEDIINDTIMHHSVDLHHSGMVPAPCTGQPITVYIILVYMP